MATIRRVLPTDRDFNSRDKLNRTELHVQLKGISETVRVRDLTLDDLKNLDGIKEKERTDYIDFCKEYLDFEGIFHAQRSLKSNLTLEQLKGLDFIQNIALSLKRLIHQQKVFPTAEEAISRIQQFMVNSPKTHNIPLLDMQMAGKNKKTKEALKVVLEWWAKKYVSKDIAFIYRAGKLVVREWDAYFTPFLLEKIVKRGGDVYVLQVPTKAGEYAALIDAFLRGATKVSLKRGRPFAKFPALFLEPNAELRTREKASKGIVKYADLDRLEYLKQDGRKSYVIDFARWDRLVQANELCRTRWTIEDLRNVPELAEAIRYFSQ